LLPSSNIAPIASKRKARFGGLFFYLFPVEVHEFSIVEANMKQALITIFKGKTDRLTVQFFRYGFVGVIAYLVDFGLLFVFTEYAGIPYLISAALSFLAGLATNYLLSILWVFKTRSVENRMAEFSMFTFIGVAGLGLNELLLWIFTGLIGWHYLLSKLAATPLVFLWNFFVRRVVLFSPSRRFENSSGEPIK